ncbi:MAG: FAD-dependent oxidoreductase, partial [Myxococcota bacterium]
MGPQGAINEAHMGLLCLMSLPSILFDKLKVSRKLGQSKVRVVFSQHQTMLGSAREHSIGLSPHTSSHQIVDQDADIALGAFDPHALASSGGSSGDESLCRSFLIARGTVHLQHREIKGLFFAGQVNGTSGYEEAAA